jgi:hypothetical protein
LEEPVSAFGLSLYEYLDPHLEIFCGILIRVKRIRVRNTGKCISTFSSDSLLLIAAYLVCRSEYGRLGLGPGTGDAKLPAAVPALSDKTCVEVACGTAVSYAVTESGGALFVPSVVQHSIIVHRAGDHIRNR